MGSKRERNTEKKAAKADKIMLRIYIVTWFVYALDDEKTEWSQTDTGDRVQFYTGAINASSIGDVEKIVFDTIVPKYKPFKVTVAPTGYISAGMTKEVANEKVMVYENGKRVNTEVAENDSEPSAS